MHFINYIKKYFDAEIIHDFDPEIVGTNNTGKDVDKIFVYEKNNDSEPLLILVDSWWYTDTKERNRWLIKNVYSSLEHNREVSEDEFRRMVKNGEVKSQYDSVGDYNVNR